MNENPCSALSEQLPTSHDLPTNPGNVKPSPPEICRFKKQRIFSKKCLFTDPGTGAVWCCDYSKVRKTSVENVIKLHSQNVTVHPSPFKFAHTANNFPVKQKFESIAYKRLLGRVLVSLPVKKVYRNLAERFQNL